MPKARRPRNADPKPKRADARRARAGGLVARYPTAGPFLLLLALLSATAEERTFGTVSDEQQMLYTAVSIAEHGEIGIARGPLLLVNRPEGDGVMPYGMGLPIVETLPALVAGRFERSFGPGSSQTLFVAVQVLIVGLCALAAGVLARDLGGGRTGFLVALFGVAFGSPLWAYTSSGLSEPLQALCLIAAVLASVRSADSAARSEADGPVPRGVLALAGLAGFAAGYAVLAKSLNLVIAPLALLPLAFDGRLRPVTRFRLAAAAAAGAFAPLAAWLGFEIARFGGPLRSYGGQSFSHPMLDGLWRLLVGVNKGLVFYFPLLALAVLGAVALARRPERRGTALALAGCSLALLVTSAAWWAWDGTIGWGPRFLVPALPLLGVAAGWCAGTLPRGPRLGAALVGAGLVINALGVLQTSPAVAAYVETLPPVKLSAEDARGYPAYDLRKADDGSFLLARYFVAASDAALSPLRVHAFTLMARLLPGGVEAIEKRLAAPPWLRSRPELAPSLGAASPLLSASAWTLRTPFSWPYLGMSFGKARDAHPEAFNAAWDAGLADQILRNVDLGRADLAVEQGERLFELTPGGYSAALYAEALRAAGRREAMHQLLGMLPSAFRSSPSLAVVQALAARDAGDEEQARTLLRQVARAWKRPALVAAVDAPMDRWPRNLHLMTGENLRDRALALPGVGSASTR